MEKFYEACIIIILVLLIYIIFKAEKFTNTFAKGLAAREFNFKNDKNGYSQADKYLATILNK